MEERKNRVIRVKDLVIHAENVQIVKQEKDHHHKEDNRGSEEHHRGGPWDWIWGGRRE